MNCDRQIKEQTGSQSELDLMDEPTAAVLAAIDFIYAGAAGFSFSSKDYGQLLGFAAKLRMGQLLAACEVKLKSRTLTVDNLICRNLCRCSQPRFAALCWSPAAALHPKKRSSIGTCLLAVQRCP